MCDVAWYARAVSFTSDIGAINLPDGKLQADAHAAIPVMFSPASFHLTPFNTLLPDGHETVSGQSCPITAPSQRAREAPVAGRIAGVVVQILGGAEVTYLSSRNEPQFIDNRDNRSQLTQLTQRPPIIHDRATATTIHRVDASMQLPARCPSSDIRSANVSFKKHLF